MTTDLTADRVALISTAPAQRAENRVALVAAIFSCLIFIAVLPFVRTPLPRIDAFIPAYQSALVVSDLVTAVLLFGQFGVLRSRALFVLAAGYLFTALMAAVHALTFPGLFTATGLLGAGPDSTAWIYMFWHSGFPLVVIYYALFKGRNARAAGTTRDVPRPARRDVAIAVLTVAAAAGALTALATGGQGMLPAIMNGNQMAPRIVYVVYPVWALSFVALAVLWLCRPHSVLDVWLMVVMCAWIAEIPLSAVFNGGRFTLGYYVGRLYGLGSATFVLVALLLEISALYSRLARSFKTALTDLRDSEERFRGLFEDVPVGLYRSTQSGTILEVNPAFVRMLGYPSREALVGTEASLLYADQHTRTEWAARLRREGEIVDFETQLRKRDGTVIWVRESAHTVCDASGVPVFHDGAVVDVTERKRAEEAFRGLYVQLEQKVLEQTAELREAKSFLETLVTLGPSIIFKLDSLVRPTRTAYISPNVERILGYSPEEVRSIAGFWEAQIHPDDREAYRTALATALRERRTQFELEVRMEHKTGGYRWIHSAFRLEYDREGAPISILGYDQDITERKTAEEALKRAQADADRANQAKSEFLSRMSHELRTPLNAILGFAQLLDMGSLDTAPRRNIQHILKGGQHLLGLINEVLDIARIEAGRLSFSPEPVRAREVMQESLDLVRPLAAEMDAHLDVDGTAPPDRYILVDRQRLKQVLLNLLANAIKYNRRGGKVALSCVDAAEDALRITVSDTGPGISPDNMARLFTPFERLGAERTSIQGSGLGLALSKRLVELMGGTLGVESTLGQGSTFWVEFPVEESPLTRARGQEGLTPAPVPLQAPSRSATILYIEDNLSNFEVIEQLMAFRPGATLIPAMQGQVGLDLARQHHPHVILLDVHLPDIPGHEVLKRLRDDPQTSHIPVVVISADATPGQIDRLTTAGASAYLTKPLDVRKLLALLDGLLKESEGLKPRKTV